MRIHERKLFRSILDLWLKNARHEGYIARVREIEAIPDESATFPVDTASLADQITSADTEEERDHILDGLSHSTLDSVLGRSGDRFLRTE